MKARLIILCILFGVIGYSQNTIIRLMPNLGQGYLVLDKTDYPQVNKWRTTIYKKASVPGAVPSYDVVLTTILDKGLFHQKIPMEYRTKSSGQDYF